MSDSFDLQRFVDAQAAIYPRVIEELSRGRKQTHWMWFVFPQMAGLGFSAMAQPRGGSWSTICSGLVGRMHAPRHGRKRKDHNRHPRLSR